MGCSDLARGKTHSVFYPELCFNIGKSVKLFFQLPNIRTSVHNRGSLPQLFILLGKPSSHSFSHIARALPRRNALRELSGKFFRKTKRYFVGDRV
jgi:hypothetical protein